MSKEMEKVQSIISNSGNAFHCNVLKYMRKKGWTVLISPYYNDNISSKPREIDLIAEKAFKIKEGFGGFKGTLNVKLFIECKYISQKTVFWFHHKDKQKAEDMVIRTTALPRNNTYTQKHHYLEGNDFVAKLFADERKASTENEIFYKALNQSLNAMVYYRDRKSIIQFPVGQDKYIKKIINYPVIICNSFDNLYAVDIESDDDPYNIDKNFQLEVNYAYIDSNRNNKEEYFLIDIINFDLIHDFLGEIQSDTNVISFLED